MHRACAHPSGPWFDHGLLPCPEATSSNLASRGRQARPGSSRSLVQVLDISTSTLELSRSRCRRSSIRCTVDRRARRSVSVAVPHALLRRNRQQRTEEHVSASPRRHWNKPVADDESQQHLASSRSRAQLGHVPAVRLLRRREGGARSRRPNSAAEQAAMRTGSTQRALVRPRAGSTFDRTSRHACRWEQDHGMVKRTLPRHVLET